MFRDHDLHESDSFTLVETCEFLFIRSQVDVKLLLFRVISTLFDSWKKGADIFFLDLRGNNQEDTCYKWLVATLYQVMDTSADSGLLTVFMHVSKSVEFY